MGSPGGILTVLIASSRGTPRAFVLQPQHGSDVDVRGDPARDLDRRQDRDLHVVHVDRDLSIPAIEALLREQELGLHGEEAGDLHIHQWAAMEPRRSIHIAGKEGAFGIGAARRDAATDAQGDPLGLKRLRQRRGQDHGDNSCKRLHIQTELLS